VIVKICGLTTREDSMLAVEAHANMLGFNFYRPSPRYISPQACRMITAELKQHLRRPVLVGVFVNSSLNEINDILEICSLDLAQLSGNESEDLLEVLGERAFKALRPLSSASHKEFVERYPQRKSPPACLVDAHLSGSYGGSGQTADWKLAAEIAARTPILLAGGLTPDNVGAAIAQVRPWGVDVATGVESSPGRKDWYKMKEFIESAYQAGKESKL
jgi:phosphoribosylanthranilate isomerase